MLFELPAVGKLATLSDGGTELVLAPECGARIVSFRVHERDVLRRAEALGPGVDLEIRRRRTQVVDAEIQRGDGDRLPELQEDGGAARTVEERRDGAAQQHARL